MKRLNKYHILSTFLILTLLLFPDTNAEAQCAMCKAVVENGSNDGLSIGAGLNKGILYLMGIPYILLFILFRTRLISFFKEFTALYKVKPV